MKTKTCPICGKEFEPRVNQKYCSPVCRDEGEKRKRQEWYERTDYLKRQRETRQQRSREREQREVDQINERQRKQWADFQEKLAVEKEAEEAELKRRAAEGDPEALMKLSDNSLDYYRYFAQAEIESAERETGRKSTVTINDISVYDPQFAERVVESIERLGRCFTRR